MGANRTVVLYFRDRMTAAGYYTELGFRVPDFAKSASEDVKIEIWLTDGEEQMWQNTRTPLESRALIECYVYRIRIADEDREGRWYDDVEDAVNALCDNPEDRVSSGQVWWDNEIIDIDFVSPLKRWNNSSEHAANFLCARIDLKASFLNNIANV